MMLRLVVFVATLLGVAHAQPAGMRGHPPAVAAARQLVELTGGPSVWRAQTLEVEERAYLRSGEVAELRIIRDFEQGARYFESVTASRIVVEWVSPPGGWTARNGQRSAMSSEDLAIELQGLRQEPYAVYHRIARDDPDLRAELRDEGRRLLIYDRDERLLCWFDIDAKGGLIGWGNYFAGAANQHYYGPLADMGDVNLPRWGASSNGDVRFEYVAGRVRDDALREPAQVTRGF